jgi:hypothetical protein
METEYIIISKTAIQQRIDDLKATDTASWEYQLGQINTLNEVLSQSTPLIPEIEKAFDAGRTVKNYKGEWKEAYSDDMTSAKYEESKDYIANLKLDI